MRVALGGAALLALAACGGPAEPVWAPDADVSRAIYAHDGPPRVTLMTSISTRNGSGAHTAMMVNGSQRVIFDPAGTFSLPFAPERNDVHYGATERVRKVYEDYYARETFSIRVQEVDVTRAEADALIREAESYGAVPKAQCALAISRILNRQPRFRSMPVSYFPNTAAKTFGRLPGATERLVTDDDADDNHGVLLQARHRPMPALAADD